MQKVLYVKLYWALSFLSFCRYGHILMSVFASLHVIPLKNIVFEIILNFCAITGGIKQYKLIINPFFPSYPLYGL